MHSPQDYTVCITRAGELLKQSRYPGTEDSSALADRVYAWLQDEQLYGCRIDIFAEPQTLPQIPAAAPPISRAYVNLPCYN